MTKVRFKIQDSDSTKRCPKCGNRTEFKAISEQVQEDGCEIWVECNCGYDPFTWKDKIESVMGRIDAEVCRIALGCWNDIITANTPVDLTRGQPNTE
jgi:predicted nucleic-acid-binding Zn-ribbon protein